MVERTARQGPKAGKRFWGCSTYSQTSCNYRVDWAVWLPEDERSPLQSARILEARPRIEGYRVSFYQNSALPEPFRLGLSEAGPNFVRAFSQWRLDYPVTQKTLAVGGKYPQLFAVAEKILTRGKLTRLSPSLEESLSRLFIAEPEFPGSFAFLSNLEPEFYLDSREECHFYMKVLPRLLGRHFHHWVLPQVEISSLLPHSYRELSGRIDFLIHHPALKRPIIVEVDGRQHLEHAEADRQRDNILAENGYRVFRITTADLKDPSQARVEQLSKELEAIRESEKLESGPHVQLLHASRIAYQIQLTLLKALSTRHLDLLDSGQWKIHCDIGADDIMGQVNASMVFDLAVRDFIEYISRLCKLYEIPFTTGAPQLFTDPADADLSILFIAKNADRNPAFFIENICVPFDISTPMASTGPARIDNPAEEDLAWFLNYIFRKPSFREGQYKAISRALQGEDTVVLLPTGAGKSVTFQLAGMLLPGLSIVVEPIVALINDQVGNLRGHGIDKAAGISSQISSLDKQFLIRQTGRGHHFFVYVAPERFQMEDFREALSTLTAEVPVSLIAIDEAHCVSEWGHQFRPAYLNIGRVSRALCKWGKNQVPPLLALTGTASPTVLKDLQRELQIEGFDCIITPETFDRGELRFHVASCAAHEKLQYLDSLLESKIPSEFGKAASVFYSQLGESTNSGLIFTQTVSTDTGTLKLSEHIKSHLTIEADCYSGKPPSDLTDEEWLPIKAKAAENFISNHVPVLVCTNAFGMGIDKPNIRFTVHVSMPASIESFYQEAGRAGRDRNISHCYLLVSNDKAERSANLLNPNTDIRTLQQLIAPENLGYDDRDDITRAIYFHIQSFAGPEKEKEHILEVLRRLENYHEKQVKNIVFAETAPDAEKALHRLTILGIVNDYTCEYKGHRLREFKVVLSGAPKEKIVNAYGRFVSAYHHARKKVEVEKAKALLEKDYQEFVSGIVTLLLLFIYDVIERGRRRAIQEMLLAAQGDPTDEEFRNRIVHYLQSSELTQPIESLLEERDSGLQAAKDIVRGIQNPENAEETRGQVSRFLESYPDHPGYLMLRGISELLCPHPDEEIIKQNVVASISSALNKYGVGASAVNGFAAWAIEEIARRSTSLALQVGMQIIEEVPDQKLAKKILSAMPDGFNALITFDQLNTHIKSLQELSDSFGSQIFSKDLYDNETFHKRIAQFGQLVQRLDIRTESSQRSKNALDTNIRKINALLFSELSDSFTELPDNSQNELPLPLKTEIVVPPIQVETHTLVVADPPQVLQPSGISKPSVQTHLEFNDMTPYELGSTGLEDAIPYLIPFLEKGTNMQKKLAASAVAKLSRQHHSHCQSTVPFLLKNLACDDAQTRQYTLNALKNFKLPEGATAILEDIAHNDDKEYNRKCAFKLIGKRPLQRASSSHPVRQTEPKLKNVSDIARFLKNEFKIEIVIIQCGFFFEAYEEDVEFFRAEKSYSKFKRGDILVTGFPTKSLEYWIGKFYEAGVSFAVVEQTEGASDTKKKAREVTLSSDATALGKRFIL